MSIEVRSVRKKAVLFLLTPLIPLLLLVGCTTIRSDSPPEANFYLPDQITACTLTTLDATASYDPDGYISEYNWYIANNELSYSKSLHGVVVSWTPCWEGTYKVWLTVVDNKGASDTAYRMVTVSPLQENYVHPGDLLYHPAFYSDIATQNHSTPEGFIVGDITGHIGIVDCDFRIIEAREEEGVIKLYTIQEFVNRYRDSLVPKVACLRVENVPVIVRKRAVEFAREQLGKPYDAESIVAWVKQIFGPSYYCSELAWAAYEVGSGAYMSSDGTIYCGTVNLDAGDEGTCNFYYAVTPNEIYKSGWTYLIGYLFPQ